MKGNQSIHIVPSIGHLCLIQTSQQSCYCESCTEEDYDTCQNAHYVSPWQSVQLEAESLQQSRAMTRSEALKNIISITGKDLLTKNNTVAIASGDPGEEDYLLNVTGNGPEHQN